MSETIDTEPVDNDETFPNIPLYDEENDDPWGDDDDDYTG